MNIIQATKKLGRGRLIRRPNFRRGEDKTYLQLIGGQFQLVLRNAEGFWPQHIYTLCKDDVLADDWTFHERKEI